MIVNKTYDCFRAFSELSIMIFISKRVILKLAIIACLFCAAAMIGSCHQELIIDIQPDDSVEITTDSVPESPQSETVGIDDDSAEIIIDSVYESPQDEIIGTHDNVDNPIIPLAYHDEEKEQLIRYNWNIETGEVTNTHEVIANNTGAIISCFKWDGGSNIVVEGQLKSGSGIRILDNDYLTPVYQDFIIEDFRGSMFIRPVNLGQYFISNSKQKYQFDFSDINIPGGYEEAYIITSFYFKSNHAYFLLYPILNNSVEKNLAIIDYDMFYNAYEVNMVINNPEFVGAVPPAGLGVSSSGNKFLVCNFLDGVYEIDGGTHTAQKLFDNYDFALKDNLDYFKIHIYSASYYNGYLLLAVSHNLISEEVDSTTFVVLKDGEVVAMMNTKETFYMPSL